jgi:hypothetical protein
VTPDQRYEDDNEADSDLIDFVYVLRLREKPVWG